MITNRPKSCSRSRVTEEEEKSISNLNLLQNTMDAETTALEEPEYHEILTERLRLRTLRINDAEAMMPILTKDAVMRWTARFHRLVKLTYTHSNHMCTRVKELCPP